MLTPRTGPRVPAHQVTTRHLGAAYPLLTEAGLGHKGVLVGRDLLGGSFVHDPFELYAAGILSNPNMIGFARFRLGTDQGAVRDETRDSFQHRPEGRRRLHYLELRRPGDRDGADGDAQRHSNA